METRKRSKSQDAGTASAASLTHSLLLGSLHTPVGGVIGSNPESGTAAVATVVSAPAPVGNSPNLQQQMAEMQSRIDMLSRQLEQTTVASLRETPSLLSSNPLVPPVVSQSRVAMPASTDYKHDHDPEEDHDLSPHSHQHDTSYPGVSVPLPRGPRSYAPTELDVRIHKTPAKPSILRDQNVPSSSYGNPLSLKVPNIPISSFSGQNKNVTVTQWIKQFKLIANAIEWDDATAIRMC